MNKYYYIHIIGGIESTLSPAFHSEAHRNIEAFKAYVTGSDQDCISYLNIEDKITVDSPYFEEYENFINWDIEKDKRFQEMVRYSNIMEPAQYAWNMYGIHGNMGEMKWGYYYRINSDPVQFYGIEVYKDYYLLEINGKTYRKTILRELEYILFKHITQ